MTTEFEERIRAYAAVVDAAIEADRASRKSATAPVASMSRGRRNAIVAVVTAFAVALGVIVVVASRSTPSHVSSGSSTSSTINSGPVIPRPAGLGINQIWPVYGGSPGTPQEVAVKFIQAVTNEAASAAARPSDPPAASGPSVPTWLIVTLPSGNSFQLLLAPVAGGWAVMQVDNGPEFSVDPVPAFKFQVVAGATSYTVFYRVGDLQVARTDESSAARSGTIVLPDVNAGGLFPYSAVIVARDASGRAIAVRGGDFGGPEMSLQAAASAYNEAILRGTSSDVNAFLSSSCSVPVTDAELADMRTVLQPFGSSGNPPALQVVSIDTRDVTTTSGDALVHLNLPSGAEGNDNWLSFIVEGGRWRLAGCARLPFGGFGANTTTGTTSPTNTTTTAPASGSAGPIVNFLGLTFADKSHGWLLAADGNQNLIVEASVDGGASWARTTVPTIAGPDDVFGSVITFSDSLNGYVQGGGGVLYATHDGAHTWVQAPITDRVLRVSVGPSEDWVVTRCATTDTACSDRLFVSQDHGDHWAERSRLPAGPNTDLSNVVRSGTTAWAYSVDPTLQPRTPSILYSSDSGAHWAARPVPCVDTAELQVTGAADLWLVCGAQPGGGVELKSVYRSVDGGLHWVTVASNFDATKPIGSVPIGGYVSTLAATSDRDAWIGLSRGATYVSHDRGATWQEVAGLPPPESFVSAIDFVDAQHGWAAVTVTTGSPNNGIYRTIDGGRTWQHVSNG